MEKTAENVIFRYYKIKPIKIHDLGGGWYGRVFLAEISKEPYNVIVKIHLFPNLAAKEAVQLNTLSMYSLIKIPKIYYINELDNEIPYDILLMEYIKGINAGINDLKITEENRVIIAEEMIDNLISYHKTVNENGFGEINSTILEPSWNNYYKKKTEIIIGKAEKMYENRKISKKILTAMIKAFDNYEKIFHIPIQTARLIHGDYNTWNILLNEDLNCVKAIIDPMNCSWADSEMDLYHLNHANGKYYGLFDLYSSKMGLSENYRIKITFYELFSVIMSLYNANINPPDIEMEILNQAADVLSENMNIYGI